MATKQFRHCAAAPGGTDPLVDLRGLHQSVDRVAGPVMLEQCGTEVSQRVGEQHGPRRVT